jgi:hypothetical protein
LPFLRSDIGWKGAAVLSVLGVLVVLGHELSAVSLFFVVFALLVIGVLKREKIPYRLFVAIIPAAAIFLVSNLGLFGMRVSLDRMILRVNDSVYAHPGGLYFLTDYLNVFTPIESYANYFELFSGVFSLFVLLYLVLLPLISVGYFKDRVFGSWTFLLMGSAFGCLIVPFSALLLWHRWMLMFVYPFTFFAVNGLWKVTKSWPLVDGRYGVIGFESTFRYVPSTMQSSSVPLRDTEGVIEAFEWLNVNMDSDSSLLAHDVFEFWTLLYLNEENVAIVFDHDLEAATNLAVDEGFDVVYFVWWNEDIGWYNLRFSDGWTSVFDSGRISVYQIV